MQISSTEPDFNSIQNARPTTKKLALNKFFCSSLATNDVNERKTHTTNGQADSQTHVRHTTCWQRAAHSNPTVNIEPANNVTYNLQQSQQKVHQLLLSFPFSQKKERNTKLLPFSTNSFVRISQISHFHRQFPASLSQHIYSGKSLLDNFPSRMLHHPNHPCGAKCREFPIKTNYFDRSATLWLRQILFSFAPSYAPSFVG